MKKERWSAGGLDNDLNGRLNVDGLRKTPRLTRAEGIQGTPSLQKEVQQQSLHGCVPCVMKRRLLIRVLHTNSA